MNGKPYFDKVAKQWDRMQAGFFSEAVRDKAISLAEVIPGRKAVDVGAGTGFITGGLLSLGLEVVAVDASKAMLDMLKAKFPGEEKTLECRMGLAEVLPLALEEADYVFANMLLHHVSDPLQAIQEFARVLKKQGALVITDLDEHSHTFLKKEHHDKWMGFSRTRVATWFEQAGFEQVQVADGGQDCCAASCDCADQARISIFAAKGVKS